METMDTISSAFRYVFIDAAQSVDVVVLHSFFMPLGVFTRHFQSDGRSCHVWGFHFPFFNFHFSSAEFAQPTLTGILVTI